MGADCVFCRILAGELPASFIAQEEHAVAFLDLHPITPGHSLVVPRRHAASAADLDGTSADAVWRLALRVNAAVRSSGVRCDAVNFLLADGEAAGQEVFHVHLHVLPRFDRDGFGHRFPDGYGPPAPREELDAVAHTIAAGL